MAIYDFKCDKCSLSGQVKDTLRIYTNGQESLCVVPQCLVFCTTCNSVTFGEKFAPIDELKLELKKYDPESRKYKKLKNLIKIISSRKSPEKCLECGSDMIVRVNDNGPTPHNDCQGQIHINPVGFNNSKIRLKYDLEGNALREN